MATQKVTVTLPAEQVEAIRRLIASGAAPNLSAFVQRAVAVALDDVAGWADVLAQALTETGGDLTDEERRWADRILGFGNAGRDSAA